VLLASDGARIGPLEQQLSQKFEELVRIQSEIRHILEEYADNKLLKGNELVGWLGEIYGKLLYGGRLVSDNFEHDFETNDGSRISVKARKGKAWRDSGVIAKIDGDDCPTHLLFLRLTDNYLLHTAWLHEWPQLKLSGRFRERKVRDLPRAYVFRVNETMDRGAIVYRRDGLATIIPTS
jgi:hypothetical protein